MIKKIPTRIFVFFLFLVMVGNFMQAQQRFPKPEFETGYVQPSPTTPEPRSIALEYFDVAVLLAVLSLASWLAIRKRSRRGLLWISIFSLVYFGFYRDGCICSIGAIQNVALSIFDPTYAISITALLFFLLPLLFALFFGRTFCAAACPLGAIQDLLVIHPISLPSWIRKTLGFIPVIYLGLAVLLAATGSDFIICRYDPFVGIFRMDGPFLMIFLGITFLLLGMFYARPYCRVFCPYGVLLSWMSKFSKWHMTITPSACIKCKLCKDSCPFDTIEKPVEQEYRIPEVSRKNLRRFILYIGLIPLLTLLGGWIGSRSHIYLSRVHPDVYLAELIITNPELKEDEANLDIQAFLEAGKSFEQLVEEAVVIRSKFKKGGWALGGFIGLVLGITLMNQVVFRRREDYEPHKGDCFSCGRCMDYCPVERPLRGK
ncbi:MAG: 4Fe-4S binding protein [Bacteroidales bacterium]|nr:4Fe-4S binding protein [Bacteroidales bacterium]